MIPRYCRPEMARLWSSNFRFNQYRRVLCALLRVQTGETLTPHLTEGFEARVNELEVITRHEFVAFLQALEEILPRRWHHGLTSSDVQDTATVLQMKEACDLVLRSADSALLHLENRARATAKLVCIGRTHGQSAELTTLGCLFASHHAELSRATLRLHKAEQQLRGKLSGAVGSYGSVVTPEIEHLALAWIGLFPEVGCTQVLPRDKWAEVLQALAAIGNALDRLAVNVRLLSIPEIGELREGGAQAGSSAMPHKHNPIASENLCSLARLLRQYAAAELESCTLWLHRDLSHSAVEREVLPSAFAVADWALLRASALLRDLEVREDQVAANVARTGLSWASERVLLWLVESGRSRTEAHAEVKRWCVSNLRAQALAAGAPESLFDPESATSHCAEVIERALRCCR